MFLKAFRPACISICLPHAGGGVSDDDDAIVISYKSSPRRWGCFSHKTVPTVVIAVFPTQVGVFLREHGTRQSLIRLPHAGGGVSFWRRWRLGQRMSSPRRWGCFLSKDLLFRWVWGLPHAGGGVSCWSVCWFRGYWSSPRRWGCFYMYQREQLGYDVFPTQVGVFLDYRAFVTQFNSLPHAGGGVSQNSGAYGIAQLSSPRRWGCF